jgi:predicted SnoaL-like aldol condensation-catalyzing enzyme
MSNLFHIPLRPTQSCPVNLIVADILRIEDGILVEYWDVIQDEATQERSKSGPPMFGDKFPNTLGRTK